MTNKNTIKELDSKYISLRKVLLLKLKNNDTNVLNELYDVENMLYDIIKENSDIEDFKIDNNILKCNKFNECLDKVLKFYKII
jgi:hypothetical protein